MLHWLSEVYHGNACGAAAMHLMQCLLLWWLDGFGVPRHIEPYKRFPLMLRSNDSIDNYLEYRMCWNIKKLSDLCVYLIYFESICRQIQQKDNTNTIQIHLNNVPSEGGWKQLRGNLNDRQNTREPGSLPLCWRRIDMLTCFQESDEWDIWEVAWHSDLLY